MSQIQKLYIEGEEGDKEEGELLTLGLRRKEYFNLNILDFVANTLNIRAQNLADLNPGLEENQRIYLHNGEGIISTDEGNTNKRGFYAWDNNANEFKSITNW
jgi:hypothetical protein